MKSIFILSLVLLVVFQATLVWWLMSDVTPPLWFLLASFSISVVVLVVSLMGAGSIGQDKHDNIGSGHD